mmetsp:Transcript_69156/g.223531  ORF Transcript_69156/g.223531 Transcript_69156/m.223531 type:complete len:181 (-) Transcript_69156:702-1244(-)
MCQPRSVALRELDGLPFVVVVLRVQGEVADVAYLDDGNVETGVPTEELAAAAEADVQAAGAEPEARWEQGLALLEAQAREEACGGSRPATASGMRWEEGSYTAEDGTVILSTSASLAPACTREPEAPPGPQAPQAPHWQPRGPQPQARRRWWSPEPLVPLLLRRRCTGSWSLSTVPFLSM